MHRRFLPLIATIALVALAPGTPRAGHAQSAGPPARPAPRHVTVLAGTGVTRGRNYDGRHVGLGWAPLQAAVLWDRGGRSAFGLSFGEHRYGRTGLEFEPGVTRERRARRLELAWRRRFGQPAADLRPTLQAGVGVYALDGRYDPAGRPYSDDAYPAVGASLTPGLELALSPDRRLGLTAGLRLDLLLYGDSDTERMATLQAGVSLGL